MTVDALTAVRMPTPIQLEQAKPGRTPRQPAGTAASAPEKARNDAASAERAEETLSFEKAGELLDQYLQRYGRTLEFSVDPTTGRPVVRVLDLHTKELIRQIPSEEVLRVARHLDGHAHAIVDLMA